MPSPNLTILLAEDSQSNRELIVRGLGRVGHEVVAVEDGQAAVNALSDQHNEYNGVLMDCQMPILNGFEATAQIRKLDEAFGRHTIIVGFTANGTANDKQECLNAGMDSWIAKPIAMKELRNLVVRLFGPKE